MFPSTTAWEFSGGLESAVRAAEREEWLQGSVGLATATGCAVSLLLRSADAREAADMSECCGMIHCSHSCGEIKAITTISLVAFKGLVA